MSWLGGWLGGWIGGWAGRVTPPTTVIPLAGASGMIPWLPENGAQHAMSWKTDTLKAWDGTERRIALLEYPRESYSAEFLLDDYATRYLRSQLAQAQVAVGVFMLPIREERLEVVEDFSGTTITVGTTTLSDWAVAGQRVACQTEEGVDFVANIVSVTSTTIEVDDTPSSAMPAFLTGVFPLMEVRLSDGQPTGYYRANAGRWRIEARITRFPTSMGTGASLTTYDSMVVLDKNPSANDIVQESNQAGLELIDYGAAIETDSGRSRSDIQRSNIFTIRNRNAADRQFWKLFLYTVRGSQTAFLLPTWLTDLVVYAQPTSTSLHVYADATNGNYFDDWYDSAAHRWLQLEMTDGTILHRKIVSAADNGDGTNTITMNTAVNTSGVNPDISRISFMEKCRLSADDVTFSIDEDITFQLSATVVEQ